MPSDERFLLEDFEPAYLALQREGRLADRAEKALVEMASCCGCPHGCEVNRLDGEVGICGIGRRAVVSSVFPHMGEEDVLRGTRGSGTIFFSGCNLRCVFCQNFDISHATPGKAIDARELAALMLHVQNLGCHNVNLVTPAHVVGPVIEALALAVDAGLRLPVVYNTSAYDALDSLKLLDGLVDIYMPDFKFWETDTARAYTNAEDYPERAREAIREMHRQVGPLKLGRDGVARRGVLVRHLVMPGLGEESAAIFRWFAEEISEDTFVNLMGQYRPSHKVGRLGAGGVPRHEAIDRRPTLAELRAVRSAAEEAGLWRFDDR
jgi:putative pyruvate formate lyase activating enzyme